MSEIPDDEERRLRRRRIARVATVAGAPLQSVVAVALTVDAVDWVDGLAPSSSGAQCHRVAVAVADCHAAVHATHPAVQPDRPRRRPRTTPLSNPSPSAVVSETHPLTSFPSPPSMATVASVVKQLTLPGSGADAIADRLGRGVRRRWRCRRDCVAA